MSVRPRILFPVEDHSVVDVNNVSGVRRRRPGSTQRIITHPVQAHAKREGIGGV